MSEAERFALKYGVRLEFVRAFEERNGVENVLKKFLKQRRSARHRGIEWLFDLKSWLEVWEGKLAKRGKGLRDYCMCRHKDLGPYAPWNVRIATGYENWLDWWEKKPKWDVNCGKFAGSFKGPARTRGLIEEHDSLSRRPNVP